MTSKYTNKEIFVTTQTVVKADYTVAKWVVIDGDYHVRIKDAHKLRMGATNPGQTITDQHGYKYFFPKG